MPHPRTEARTRERERRGEGREGEDYHKEAAINARPNRAANETRPLAPKKIPQKAPNQELD